MTTIHELGSWQYVSCPVCHADDPIFVTHDWQVIQGKQYTFNLVRCNRCGVVYVNPRLDREQAIGTPGGGAWHAAVTVNHDIYQAGLQQLVTYFKNKSPQELKLLDIGCGYGAFMDAAKKTGFQVEGVEIDPKIAEAAHERGYTVYVDFLNNLNLPPKSYDIITLWDVIEHVPDPVSLLTESHRLLKPGGILFYHTGNAAFQVTKGRILAKLRPGRGPNNIPIQHLLHLSDKTSRYLLRLSGDFDSVDVRFLGTLRYPNKTKFAAMKTYNEITSLLFRLGFPLWTTSIAVFAHRG